MANIPIRDIPGAVVASPDPSNLIPMDNGSIMQKTTIANAVNETLPLSSQAEAEAGVDNAKRMSSLRTKQAIDAQTPAIVNVAITALNLGTMSQEEASDYTPTSGLAAVALSNDYDDLDNLPTLGTAAATDATDYATAAQGAAADTAVQPGDLAAVATSGDYGDLSNKPTLGTAAALDVGSTSGDVAAGDRGLPTGGTTAQALVKASDSNYDVEWVTSAAATAVSYAAQSLSAPQQQQARENIDALGLGGGTMTGDLDMDGNNILNVDPWAFQPVGVPIPLSDNLVGVAEPPIDKDYRYVKLTASDAYNTGILTGESVSGSAPLVIATAVIDLVNSPLDGETINLINTERRFLRAGAAGTVENDQTQDHNHTSARNATYTIGGSAQGMIGAAGTDPTIKPYTISASDSRITDGAGGTGARIGTETRPKNIGVTYYMRVK